MLDRAHARIVSGHAAVLREVQAAGPLMARLAAPLTARESWLTAALDAAGAHRWSGRPIAVVVDGAPAGPPQAAAFLSLRRRGPLAVLRLLGQEGVPLPGGRPTARLLAADDAAAEQLATGIVGLLDALRGPASLRLTGLPLGDPTARGVAARLRTAVLANVRGARVVDELDAAGPVERSRDPQEVDRHLPALLEEIPGRRARDLLRAAVHVHAANDQVEVAATPQGALLTLVDGDDRWPWWSTAGIAGLRTEMGAPSGCLRAPARRWPR